MVSVSDRDDQRDDLKIPLATNAILQYMQIVIDKHAYDKRIFSPLKIGTRKGMVSDRFGIELIMKLE